MIIFDIIFCIFDIIFSENHGGTKLLYFWWGTQKEDDFQRGGN